MKINIIAAVGKNLELGKDNKLIWPLKEDLKYFKQIRERMEEYEKNKLYQKIFEEEEKSKNKLRKITKKELIS